MSNKKDSIIFYLSHYKIVKKTLNNEQLGRLYSALFEKQLGNEVVLEEDITMAFDFINNQLLVDKKKYEETSLKRSIAGKKGGAPKGNKNASKNKQTSKTNNNKQNKLNDNEKEKENDNDYPTTATTNNNTGETIFDVVQAEFGRELSPMEYEIIVEWLENLEMSEDLIKNAIRETTLNGATSLKYTQRILERYKREKIKTVSEAQKQVVGEMQPKEESKELFDYNWLDDSD